MSNDEEEEKRRQEILKTRAEHQRLGDMIIQGTDYRETMKVRGRDGHEYEVEIHAINDEEFIQACGKMEIEVPEAGKPVTIGGNLKLLAALAIAGTGDLRIMRNLAPLESTKIGTRVLELSGYAGGPKPDLRTSLKASTAPRSRSS